MTGQAVLPILQALDRWVVQHVTNTGLFGDMSAEDIAKQYHSCLQFSDKYNSHRLRTPVNISGINSCKWFKYPEREAVQYTSLDLRQSVVQPVIHFKGIWKQASQWGLSLDVIKALVDANGSDSWDF